MNRNKVPQFVGRLITAIIVLGITAFFTPGFATSSIWVVALAVLLLTVFDFAISTFTALFTHPIVKGIIGFVLCISFNMLLLVMGYLGLRHYLVL